MRVRSVEGLAARSEAGDLFSYVFFWGHKKNAEGLVTKSCLSNWWPAQFELEGERWSTTEQYMMFAKARLFGDEARMAAIRGATDPKDVKSLGRAVRPYGDLSWAAHRYGAVVRANHAKFEQHPDLRAFLHGTGDAVLVEASPMDKVWGIGLAEGHADAKDPSRWQGANLLGFALMDVRDALAD